LIDVGETRPKNINANINGKVGCIVLLMLTILYYSINLQSFYYRERQISER